MILVLDEDIHTDSRSLLMERDSLTPSPRFGDSSEATEKTSIRYKSTRGGEVDVTFRDAILKGLAEDGEFQYWYRPPMVCMISLVARWAVRAGEDSHLLHGGDQ